MWKKEMNMSDKTKPIKITRIYAEQGKSLFGELEIETKLADIAPPAPQMGLSAWFPAAQFQLMSQPPGWVGEWHYAPKRFLFCVLAGEFGAEVSSGERRQFPAGELVLVEDKPGQGHRSWVVGNTNLVTAVIELPDNALLK
jgi:hypothetical protein